MIVKANCKLTEKRLASIKAEIIAVPLWNHMSADELGKAMGLSGRYLYGAMATLRARGEIEQASPLSLLQITRYHHLNKLLDNPQTNCHIDNLVKKVLGANSVSTKSARRCKLRELIATCKKAGFPIHNESRIHSEQVDQLSKMGKASKTLRYIPLSKVDPDHLAKFVNICQKNGGRHAA
ncbi:hypothetical protein ACK36J_14360 [Aeromonas veronii]